ncbi:hypothetical protein [Campylobacter troglodytis]|uniref:hypothetical protein n=1 Tax=Campylobacter troglodytis TaxID=654363 RepID=UPI00115C3229|nr:hypothetical protein [Campylobacter troglodytis]
MYCGLLRLCLAMTHPHPTGCEPCEAKNPPLQVRGIYYVTPLQVRGTFCLYHLRLCKSQNISQFKKEFLRYAQYENFCLCHIEFS